MRGMVFAAVLAAVATAAGADDACHLTRYVSLPMTIESAGRVTVPVTLDGQVMNLLVDTGGAFSGLTESAAERLKLEPKTLRYVQFKMIGGKAVDKYVTVKSMEIAGSAIANRDFLLLPGGSSGIGFDGILGAEFLKLFDVDFDFANAKIGLFSQKHCEGKVVYWADDYAAVPFKLNDNGHIRLTLQLDGKDVDALIDTGAAFTLMSLEEAAYAFDLDADAIKANRNRHPFKTLSFGGVTVNNPDIVLVPDERTKIIGGFHKADMILGMGVLRQLHLYIAYKEKKLYVTGASAHK